jgi:hypothetical protein
MENFYQQFSELDEFKSMNNDDKLKFGDMYANKLIASDERFRGNPELGDFLRKRVNDDILDNIETTVDVGQGMENLKTILGEDIAGGAIEFSRGLRDDIEAVRTNGFKENVGVLGENTANVLLHTAGIPGRFITSLAQLPYSAASKVLEVTGQGDSTANKWLLAKYSGLEKSKQAMKIFNGPITEYEEGVLAAGTFGGGFGYAAQALRLQKLNLAGKTVGASLFSSTDAALLSSYSAAAGEAGVVVPSMVLADHYIDKSSYSDETKGIMKAVFPVFAGVFSAFTFEHTVDRILGNPLVVDNIVRSVKGGLGPEETIAKAKEIIKPPSLKDDILKHTNGRMNTEHLYSTEKAISVEAHFAKGASYPPIVPKIQVTKELSPRALAAAVGVSEEAGTMKSIPDAISHLVKRPVDSAKQAKKLIEKFDPETQANKIQKFQQLADKEMARAQEASGALFGKFGSNVDHMVINALQGKPLGEFPVTKQTMLFSDTWDAQEAQGVIARIIDNAGNEASQAEAKKSYMLQLENAFRNKELTYRDAKLASAISSDTATGILSKADPKEIAKVVRELGLGGQENPHLGEWMTKSIGNQGGYVTPDFLRTTALHSLPLLTGLETKDGRLNWNTNKYLKFGAPFHLIGFGGRVYRRVGGNRVVRGIGSKLSKKFWEGVDHPMLRGLGEPLKKLHPTERIDPEIYKIKKQFRKGKQGIRRTLDQFAIDLKKKYSPKELEQLSDFIEKENDWESVPKILQQQATEIQGFLTQIKDMLVDSGIEPQLIDRLGDRYLHRVYLPQLMKKPAYGLVKQKLKSIQANYLKTRGKNANMAKRLEQIGLTEDNFNLGDSVYHGVGPDGRKTWVHETQIEKLQVLKAQGPVTKWDIIEKGKGRIIANTDYTIEERQAMGESRDVALRLAVLFREASHDISLGKVFSSISGDAKLTLKNTDELGKELGKKKRLSKKDFAAYARASGFVKLPDKYTPSGIAKYGKLNGQWVHKDVEKVLHSMTGKRYTSETAETIWEVHKTLTRAWKIGKTAYSPPAHVLNTVTNLHVCIMDGRNPIAVARDGIQTLALKDKNFKEAVDAGLVDSGVLAGEWNLKQFESLTEALEPTMDNMPLVTRALFKSYKAGSKAAKFPMKLYQWEDEVFKLGVFKSERLKGRSTDEALEAANKLFLDYSDVPSGVAFLRDSGIVPFISWSYKIIPVIAESAAEHPERILGMIYAYKAISDYWYEHHYGEKAEAQAKLESKLRPEYQQGNFFGAGPEAQIRLANDPQTGEARSLDARNYIPGADLFSDFGASFPFGMHPVISTVYAMASGKHAAFGSEIVPHPKPKNQFQEAENFDAWTKFAVNTLLPNIPFIPYTYSSDRVGNALVSTGTINKNSGWLWDYAQRRGWNGKDYFKNDLDFSDEMLGSVGIKINRMDVQKAGEQALSKKSNEISDARRKLTQAFNERKSTPSRRKRALQGYLEEELPTKTNELNELTRLIQEAK